MESRRDGMIINRKTQKKNEPHRGDTKKNVELRIVKIFFKTQRHSDAKIFAKKVRKLTTRHTKITKELSMIKHLLKELNFSRKTVSLLESLSPSVREGTKVGDDILFFSFRFIFYNNLLQFIHFI